jgi:hypothetical protein
MGLFFANFRDFLDFFHVSIYCGRCTQPILVPKKKSENLINLKKTVYGIFRVSIGFHFQKLGSTGNFLNFTKAFLKLQLFVKFPPQIGSSRKD